MQANLASVLRLSVPVQAYCVIVAALVLALVLQDRGAGSSGGVTAVGLEGGGRGRPLPQVTAHTHSQGRQQGVVKQCDHRC